MSAVVLDDVTKVFGKTVAVANLSIAVADKEFVVLLGPSGCGKTTTLNMIAGLETPTSGSISIGGEEVQQVPAEKRDVSMVFQTIALYPHMSAYNNIAFPLKMMKKPRDEIAARVLSVAQLLRIENLLHRKPYELSGGERQRVGLGRAIVRDPKVFLFDEPLSSLDAKLRTSMRIEIKTLHRRLGTTFVYVTHDQVEAMTMADRIAVIDNGCIQQYGRPADVYERPANVMVADFIGNPGMNLIPGEIRREADGLVFRSYAFALPLPAAAQVAGTTLTRPKATLGIRPEHMAVVTANNGGNAVATVSGWVLATEPVGSDMFVDICFEESDEVDRTLIKVRTAPDFAGKVGEQITLALPPDRLLLFDDNGERIFPSRSPAGALR